MSRCSRRSSIVAYEFEGVRDCVAKLLYQIAVVAHMGCRATDECDDQSATRFPEAIVNELVQHIEDV